MSIWSASGPIATAPGERSDLIQMPDQVREREAEARQELLEALADTNDHMLEELLEDVVPPKDEVYDTLRQDLAEDRVVPVFFGGALADNGVRRLLKALRHDVPVVDETRDRRLVDAGDGARWHRCSRPSTPRIPARCRWPASGAARSRTAARSAGEKISGLFGFANARRSRPS